MDCCDFNVGMCERRGGGGGPLELLRCNEYKYSVGSVMDSCMLLSLSLYVDQFCKSV